MHAAFRALNAWSGTDYPVPVGDESVRVDFEAQMDEGLFERTRQRAGVQEPDKLVAIALATLVATSERDLPETREYGPEDGINSQVFGRFLVGKGAVNLKDLMKAVRTAKTIGARIGDLAVEHGFLSRDQVESIHARQAETNSPFGQLAVAMELLEEDQVADLLEVQRRNRGGIGEALVQLGILSEQDMTAYFSEFEVEQGKPMASDDEDLDVTESKAGKQLIEFLTDKFPDLAKTIANIVVDIQPPGPVDTAQVGDYTAGMQMRGDLECTLTFSVSKDFARVIMWGLFGMDFIDAVEMYPDAVGEFLNMLVGNASRALEKEGLKTRGEAPTFDPQVPNQGRAFNFVVTGQLRDGVNVTPVAPTANGVVILSNANSG